MATINRKLNIVLPIARQDRTTLYVHATPVLTETFETYYMVLAKTWADFLQNGLDPRISPSVAMLTLKRIAKETQRASGINWWDGPDGVGGDRGLIAEITRLSNVIAKADGKGWGTLPLQQALDQGLVDEDEKREILNLLVFFTVVSHVVPKRDREGMIMVVGKIYDLATTSCSVTEYAASLKTSTIAGASGGSVQA